MQIKKTCRNPIHDLDIIIYSQVAIVMYQNNDNNNK